MKARLANAFYGYLANNRERGGSQAVYGITVTDVRSNGRLPNGQEISLEFRFVRGGRYCCTELECHFRVWDSSDWASLRQQIQKQGVDIGYPITIRVRVVVEAGAMDGDGVPEDTTIQISREPYFEELT